MLFDEIPNGILTSDTYIAHHLRKKDKALHNITFRALNCLQYDKEIEEDFLYTIDFSGTTININGAGSINDCESIADVGGRLILTNIKNINHFISISININFFIFNSITNIF